MHIIYNYPYNIDDIKYISDSSRLETPRSIYLCIGQYNYECSKLRGAWKSESSEDVSDRRKYKQLADVPKEHAQSGCRICW